MAIKTADSKTSIKKRKLIKDLNSAEPQFLPAATQSQYTGIITLREG